MSAPLLKRPQPTDEPGTPYARPNGRFGLVVRKGVGSLVLARMHCGEAMILVRGVAAPGDRLWFDPFTRLYDAEGRGEIYLPYWRAVTGASGSLAMELVRVKIGDGK